MAARQFKIVLISHFADEAVGSPERWSSSGSSPDQGRYDYEADFEKGIMLVSMRLDPSGKIGAYRITAAQ